jgi:hypothetical protein
MTALIAAVFAAAGGWHVGAGQVRACQGVPASRCVQASSWAATVRWRDCGNCLPHKTIAALPRDGIALQVTVAIERPMVAKRRIEWPPSIRASDVIAGFEGISNRYGVYQSPAFLIGGREVFVWAFFGRARPTPAQLARANEEFATARMS